MVNGNIKYSSYAFRGISDNFGYCACVLRSPACSTGPGKWVWDDFTSKSRRGKYEFVKRIMRLI